MSALKEYVASLVGMYATPDAVKGGPFKIVAARHDDSTILLTLKTPDGEREFKASECRISKTEGG